MKTKYRIQAINANAIDYQNFLYFRQVNQKYNTFMRNIYQLTFIILIATLISCKNNNNSDPMLSQTDLRKQIEKDLQEIEKDGKLKAILVYDVTSYFIYKGQVMGYEYELLQKLAEYLNLELEIVIAKDVNELIPMLLKGDGDLIAHGLTVTNARKKKVSFTDYIYLTHQVLVQKKPDNWRKMKLHNIQKEMISDPIELIGDTVSVRLNSSYFARLKNLQNEIGGNIYIDTMPGDLSTYAIIEKVANGEIKYTVADNNLANIYAAYYTDLDVETDISFSQRIAWAVRKNSPEFLAKINEWIKKMKKDAVYYVIYNKYFKNKSKFREHERSDYFSPKTGKISKYDDIIKKYSKDIGWDWRFVSSIVYQESHFDPEIHSWVGAKGLMQLMPNTLKHFGVANYKDPDQNVKAGTEYLDNLFEKWSDIPDSVQRLKFTLASYNCGFYHVKDAQKLTEKYKKDPEVWDKNVEIYLLKLSLPEYYNESIIKYGYVNGHQPVNYVEEIFERYQNYKEVIPE